MRNLSLIIFSCQISKFQAHMLKIIKGKYETIISSILSQNVLNRISSVKLIRKSPRHMVFFRFNFIYSTFSQYILTFKSKSLKSPRRKPRKQGNIKWRDLKDCNEKKRCICISFDFKKSINRGARRGDIPQNPKKIVVEKWCYFPGLYKMTDIQEDGIKNRLKSNFPVR